MEESTEADMHISQFVFFILLSYQFAQSDFTKKERNKLTTTTDNERNIKKILPNLQEK